MGLKYQQVTAVTLHDRKEEPLLTRQAAAPRNAAVSQINVTSLSTHATYNWQHPNNDLHRVTNRFPGAQQGLLTAPQNTAGHSSQHRMEAVNPAVSPVVRTLVHIHFNRHSDRMSLSSLLTVSMKCRSSLLPPNTITSPSFPRQAVCHNLEREW